MKYRSIAAAFAAAALTMPGIALAQGAMSDDRAMTHDSAMAATMMCRAARAGEKPSAITSDNKPIVCKTVQPAMMMKGHGGPKITPSMTSDQVDAAWRAYIEQISAVPGGNG